MIEVVLNELPESWEWKKLGDVVTKIIGGGTPSKNKPQYWEGDIPWLTVKDMRSRRPVDAMDHISEKAVEESSTNIIPEDTVIIATRIGLGKVIRVPYKAAINQDLKAVFVPPEIDKGYLEYWFVSKANYLESIGSGTTVKGIRLEQVRNLDFPLAPLEQQKRIVAKIEELFSHIDAGIEALIKAKQLLKQYRQSVLKAAVTGELTKEWREANKDKLEPASKLLARILKERRKKWEQQQLGQFKAKGKTPKHDRWKESYKEPKTPGWEGMSELVGGWCWVTIEQLASNQPRSIQSGPFGSNLKHSEFKSDGKLVIGIDNVREGFFSMGAENRIGEEKFKELKKYMARPGDVLITVMATIGRTCVVPEELEPAVITKHVYRITIDKNLADPEYVNMYLWGSPAAREQFFGQTIGQTRPGLNGGIIKGLCIPLPSLQEQRLILESVNDKNQAIDRLEQGIELQVKKAEKNKQSILASSFNSKGFG